MIAKFPENAKDIIDEIRKQIGRVVTFVYASGVYPCTASGCSLDPTTGLSTNSFCTTCSGKYWIPNILNSGILAHITWGDFNRLALEFPGYDAEGGVRIQIEYTDEHDFIVKNCRYIVADGVELEIKDVGYRGKPTVNRIIINARQREVSNA